ncbi:hypothetical protein KP509_17G005700 [Ceratopteris richardii]|uniref:Secreted protein n=1 Tax=Ceratopteris richardii TaxID=49495 RepID=A0A8T2SRU8_CERRI|nr:hypothetical protein KP509_17G005700 [Ceratopteris richardii]
MVALCQLVFACACMCVRICACTCVNVCVCVCVCCLGGKGVCIGLVCCV